MSVPGGAGVIDPPAGVGDCGFSEMGSGLVCTGLGSGGPTFGSEMSAG